MSVFDKPDNEATERVRALLAEVGYADWMGRKATVYESLSGARHVLLSELPVLPFFVALAGSLGVELGAITVESSGHVIHAVPKPLEGE